VCNTNKPYQCQGVLFGFFLEISVKKDNPRKNREAVATQTMERL